jgi:mannose-6-phosphate isomerase-like protein (cupin superfamily)
MMMSNLRTQLEGFNERQNVDKSVVVADIASALEVAGYEIVELNSAKPWGAYFRINSNQVDQFVKDFFPGLTIEEARLGIEDAELSPKILLVAPGQRLSWQYHDRRAERWTFLTDGAYEKSLTDDEGEPVTAIPGEVVQFQRSERHRLIGAATTYTVVAEIWQHSDPKNLSSEDDIVRLADDYQR